MTRLEWIVGGAIFVTLMLLHESRIAISVPISLGVLWGAIWLLRILNRRERRRP